MIQRAKMNKSNNINSQSTQNNGHNNNNNNAPSQYARNAYDQGLSFGNIIRQKSWGNSNGTNDNHNDDNVNQHNDDSKLRQIIQSLHTLNFIILLIHDGTEWKMYIDH